MIILSDQQPSVTFARSDFPLPDTNLTEHAPLPSSSVMAVSSSPLRTTQPVANARQFKTLNLNTYKIHALGDYVSAIKTHGTTDSYSTEMVSWFDIRIELSAHICFPYQGELEHRSAKSRYTRTSRKGFLRQLAQIERRQARIRRICEKYQAGDWPVNQFNPGSPNGHHNIGKSQNQPENIPSFLCKHSGDPAIVVRGDLLVFVTMSLLTFTCWQNFILKLKRHLLPRIKAMMQWETLVTSDTIPHMVPSNGTRPVTSDTDDNCQAELDGILFKNDRMYRHNLLRINYTTYDVRRSQDVVNPNTSHREIILLANQDGDSQTDAVHPFLYARVLAIFHVNIIYNGPGMLNYVPRKIYFLWVRWFEYLGKTVTWRHQRLDSLHFPPVAKDDAFGFVDPSDVLRGCHVIQAFRYGKVHLDGTGLSPCANDSHDWRQYCMNRYLCIV
jgi:hypothetical protein